ncbi:hypothetical protein D9613_009841 [Agrocybe pediades]|uniref:Peptidase C14 caspase domain-containing protein n=1 Tax=Agrocybe pediades TaxID=84607 RepID=A0A8H4QWX6_9AGAR|nr:hypothetical protein D9613_009841 [Agrocybe pediades]
MQNEGNTTARKRFRVLRAVIRVAMHFVVRPQITFKSTQPLRNQHKRALLIGINYSNIPLWRLRGPQADVEIIKRLLIDLYGYDQGNVVVLWDKAGTPPHLLPTKENIMREIDALAASGAKHNFFMCKSHRFIAPPSEWLIIYIVCGHSYQREEDKTLAKPVEDDGMEEYIIPSNALIADNLNGSAILEDYIITDKVLKKRLVKPMKAGCQLITLFDACHSGTLLNLRHYRCNEFEGIWNRTRIACREALNYIDGTTAMKNENARRNGIEPRKPSALPTLPIRRDSIELHRPRSQFPPPARQSTIQVTESNIFPTPPRGLIQKPPSQMTADSSCLESNLAALKWIKNTCRKIIKGGTSNHCSGFCPRNPMRDRPQVFCFSACADSQMTFEGSKSGSMAQTIAEHLRKNPTPTARELMTAIKFGITVKRSDALKQQRQRRRSKQCRLAWTPNAFYKWHKKCSDEHDKNLEKFLESHCDPQLSTRYPLNLNAQIKI